MEHKAHVAKDLGRHDIIAGGNILKNMSMDIKHSTMTMSWGNMKVPMKSINATPNVFSSDKSGTIKQATSRLTEILDAKCDVADLPTVVFWIEHLTNNEKQKSSVILQKFQNSFDGTLGQWTGDLHDIEWKLDAKPHH